MSILDELKAKSIKAQAEADAAAIKKEQERLELINKITQFLLNQVADSKILNQVIEEAATNHALERHSQIYVCFEDEHHVDDVLGGKFYISGKSSIGNVSTSRTLVITKDECHKLEINYTYHLRGVNWQNLDGILVKIAKEICDRLIILGFSAGADEGTNYFNSKYKVCIVRFSW